LDESPISLFFKLFEPVPVVFTARNAIEFVVLTFCALRSNRSPASHHRAVASESFLKTHAISASVNSRWSPRAFQKISDSTAQWFPLLIFSGVLKVSTSRLKNTL
jgi:hypothetical protein